jgi:hypothetical protein
MKSLNFISKKVMICFSMTLLFSLLVSGVSTKKMNGQQVISTSIIVPDTNNTLTSPIIDATREIKGDEPSYEKVSYVKQISAGGKAALEIAESGE